jgi:DNA primase
MGIADDDIERVRSQVDLVELVSEHLALRKQGARWVGLCPFHAEKSPSFSVNRELGRYYCFGCQAKGDAISFVREIDHLDFVGAMESLAGRLGVTLHYDSTRESGERKRRSVLVDTMAKAVEWYHQRLLSADDAAQARGYLRSRGIDGDVVRRYKLGWAPDDWDALSRALKAPADDLRDTGLAFLNSRQRLQDSFRARVLFPIFDVRGDPVAIGGRVLPGSTDKAKYKNSPATPIYDKSETLYGLNWAKSPIVNQHEVVVCEGYTDVIGMAKSGVAWAVATCGTALTERHVALLKGFSPRIVLAFDADAAGQGAAERFYEWERKYEIDVYVAGMPPGSDPGELARSAPDELRRVVAEAKPFLEFRLDRLLGAANLTTAEGRARAAEAAMELVAEHPNELVRDQYLMRVADRTRIDADRLRAGPRRNRPAPRAPLESRRASRGESASLLALRLAVHDPASVAATLHEVLFDDPVELAAYRALAGAATFHDAVAGAEPDAAELLERLAVEEVDVDADDVLALLVGEAAGRVRRDIEARARESDDDFFANSQTMGWLKLRIEELRDPETRRAALDQLVPFLVVRREEVE